jgi:hypothetical protein
VRGVSSSSISCSTRWLNCAVIVAIRPLSSAASSSASAPAASRIACALVA